MDPVELYLRSREITDEVVRSAGEADWGNDTPCDEWDVRTLVNHLVNEAKWVPDILDGKTVEDVGDAYEGDLLGDDPKAAFSDSTTAAAHSWRELDSLDEIVHLSFGDVPAFVYGVQMGTDMLVHGWDIAKGLGRDLALPEDLARYAYEQNAPMITPEIRQMGIIGPEVEVADDASWGDKLLGFLGRDPHWSA